MFPMPAVIAIIVIIAFPLTYTVRMSLYDWFMMSRALPYFVGMKNYYRLLFEDSRFLYTVVRTFYFVALAVPLQTVLGLACALIFNKQFLGRGTLRVIFILPMMATPVAIALIWIMIFHPMVGLGKYVMSLAGLSSLWIHSPKTVIPSLVMVDTWQWTPIMMLIILGGLAALPQESFEAALVDGATKWQRFIYITLPLLRPFILVAILFRLIDCLKTFDIIYIMTQGGPGEASETINIYLFNTAFYWFHMGYASSIVVIFLAIILGFSLILIKTRGAK
ncbi:sugar ABC transporter permease [Candidatus Aerophobetes bacterium]|nr:sugar ABC transporter permease [Candidatus Aerophobetes bacterium]